MDTPDATEVSEASSRPEETDRISTFGGEVYFLLFALFAALISWPLITLCESKDSIFSIYVYLFMVWFAVILVLFIIARSNGTLLDNTDSDRDGRP